MSWVSSKHYVSWECFHFQWMKIWTTRYNFNYSLSSERALYLYICSVTHYIPQYYIYYYLDFIWSVVLGKSRMFGSYWSQHQLYLSKVHRSEISLDNLILYLLTIDVLYLLLYSVSSFVLPFSIIYCLLWVMWFFFLRRLKWDFN